MDKAMICNQGSGRTLNQFALVSYIPEPLASFLDDLRLQLTPGCSPHAHLTVLPPRPFLGQVPQAVHDLREAASSSPVFDVALGAIEVFAGSNVIYLGITLGADQVRELHRKLNVGVLEHICTYPFHPHVTLAQDFDALEVEPLAAKARSIWSGWRGSRTFSVHLLSFVQNVDVGKWDDLASVCLADNSAE